MNHRHDRKGFGTHDQARSFPTNPFHLTLLTRLHQIPSNLHAFTHISTAFDLPSLTSAFNNQDVVISTIAGGDVPFQKGLIDAAIAAGVHRFIPNEFNYDTQNPRVCERYSPCQARAEVLQYLREQSKTHNGFSWMGLATGCLIEEGLRGGLLGFDLRWSSATIYESGYETFARSTLRGVGRAVQELLMLGEEGGDSYFYAAEFMTCQNNILEALQTSSGKGWSIGRAEVEEAVREGEMRGEKGFFDGAMMLSEWSVLFCKLDDLSVWQKWKLRKGYEDLG